MKKVTFFIISSLLIVAVLPSLNAARSRLFMSIPDQIVQDAIIELSQLEELSCSVDCVSTIDSAFFQGGYIAIRGANDERLEKANGEVWIRDVQGFEVIRNSVSNVYEWNPSGQALDVWSIHNGVEDVRVPLIAATQASWLVSLPNEVLDGTNCVVLEGDGLKLWFNSASQNRLLKFEVLYDPQVASGIAYSVRYRDWAQFGLAEFPQTVETTAFDPDGQIMDTWHYFFYNITTGMHLSNSEFDRNNSGGSGTGGGGSGGGIGGNSEF